MLEDHYFPGVAVGTAVLCNKAGCRVNLLKGAMQCRENRHPNHANGFVIGDDDGDMAEWYPPAISQ